MKRLRIWLKNLSLLQQFFTIAFLVAVAFLMLFLTIVPNNIDNFVDAQMHTLIHTAQDEVIANEFMIDEDSKDEGNVRHFIYSLPRRKYLSELDEESKSLLEHIDPDIDNDLEYFDGTLDYDGRTIVYSIRESNGFSLVSIIRDDYRSAYSKALTDSTINTTLLIVVGLYSFVMLWVVTLIHPLNQIKNYIDKVKNGEKAKLNIDRKDEIGEVAEALIDMNEELLKQAKIREEMIQNISHDLKTPIATIKSYSESIKDGIYPYGTLEKSVDVIYEHADRLENKVLRLITFNKLGYLNDDVKKGDNLPMKPVVEKAMMALVAIRSEIVFESDLEDISFHGEEEPWRIVVENLLDNALRYAKTKIKITLDEEGLFVFNDGPLLEKERLDKLFKPYEMGSGGRFGLGLSIVKRVTETYGYRVLGENMNDGVIFKVLKPKNKRFLRKEVKDD